MAQSEMFKRQKMVLSAIAAVTQLMDAMDTLNILQTERRELVQDFQDQDFTSNELVHLTPGQVGTLFDFVLPTFQATLADVGNAGRNVQILNQMMNS